MTTAEPVSNHGPGALSGSPTPAAAGGRKLAGRLTVKNYLAYAAGDAANNLSFSLAGMFLMLYYTNVIGIAGATVGTMFLVVRVLDAFTDVAGGRLIDGRVPGRLGKFKPFILIFCLPLLLASMAIYSADVIFPGISGGAAIAYMYITYILMGSIFYTMVNIAYGSMAPSITQEPVERGKLATFRSYGASLAILALAFIIAPQISGNAEDPEALQRSLFLTTGAFVIVGVGLYLFLVFGTAEKVHRKAASVSFKDSMRTLAKNKPLIWLSGSAVLFLTGMTGFMTLGSYLAIYVQGDAQFIAWNTLAQIIPLFIVGPMIPTIVRRLGKRVGYIGFACIGGLGGVFVAVAPISTYPMLGLVAFFLFGLGLNGVNTLMWALEADTVEYGEWRTGQRAEGTTYAVFSFTRKVGQAVGGFVGGLALTLAGFDAARASSGQAQLDGVGQSIQIWTGALVVVFMVVALVVMLGYPLTESRFREITEEIATRRTTAASD